MAKPPDTHIPANAALTPGAARTAAIGASALFDPLNVRGYWQAYFDNLSRIGNFRWDNNHLGGASYDFAKQLAQQMVDLTPVQYRAALDAYLRKPQTQSLLRGENMASLFEMVGQQLELIKKTRRLWGLPVQDAELFGPAYNHQFLAEDATGKIVAVSEKQLLGLFPQANYVTGEVPKQFPHVVITSSHARGETLKDVTEITHGIEANINKATHQKAKFAKIDLSRPDLGVSPDETLILYRCDVRENPWLNGAALLRRMNELKVCEQTGAPDAFKEASPGAWAINHLMLAWMSQQPQQILEAKDMPLAKAFANGGEPIELRLDAGRVAQHIMLDGYSKGGNVVSDAGPRMLPHELQAKDGRGRDLFFCEQDGEMRPIARDGVHEVRKIVRQIPTWACASVEFGLTDEQIAAGANRTAFNSELDDISRHDNYPGRRHDERHIIKGVKEDNGHAPVTALGARTKDGYTHGYAMDDPRVARRMEELCAPMIGKATLEGIRFDTGDANEIRLEVGPGTSDRLVETHRATIIEALERAGLEGAVLNNPHPFSGEFLLTFPHAVIHDTQAMQKLQQAFQALRSDAPGLVICERLLHDDIAAHIAHLQHPLATRAAGTVVQEVATRATLVDSPTAAPQGRTRGASGASRPKWGTRGIDPKPGSALDDLTG
jgi:hypothetical protein